MMYFGCGLHKDLLAMLMLLLCVIAIFFTNIQCENNCDPSSKWMRESKLHTKGKMVIKWNFTDEDLTMMMIAETTGWLAVGFGPKRENFVDIALGWVSKNGTNLQDRYISSNASEPTLDKTESIEIVGGDETKNSTYICFRRKILACDDGDYTITEGTTNVTWMFGEKDPVDGQFQFESAMKGRKYEHILSVVYPKPSSETYSFQAPNTTVSSKFGDTLYWCSYHKVPAMTNQFYMTGFDSVVMKRSIGIVHHAAVYSCDAEKMDKIYNTVDSSGYDCNSKPNAPLAKICRTLIAVWAMGGEDQYFPPSVGTAFGIPNATSYYRLEIHYNIPSQIPEYKDSSSVKLYITKSKPKNILAILFTGFQISPMLIIPPGQKNFSVIAGCQSKCLQQNIPKDGITVIGVRFHAHKMATKFRLHIFRDKQEQKPLIENNFDFEYQGFRFLKNELKLFPNDRLAMECTYDTTEKNGTVVGEEATEDEMCVIFLMYYPRMINLDLCMSFIKPENILNLTGIQEIGLPKGVEKCEGPDCQAPIALSILTPPIPITKPSQYANITLYNYLKNFTDWTPKNIEKLSQFYYGEQNPVCSGHGKVYYSKETDVVQYPTDAAPYVSPDTCRN